MNDRQILKTYKKCYKKDLQIPETTFIPRGDKGLNKTYAPIRHERTDRHGDRLSTQSRLLSPSPLLPLTVYHRPVHLSYSFQRLFHWVSVLLCLRRQNSGVRSTGFAVGQMGFCFWFGHWTWSYLHGWKRVFIILSGL